MATASALGVSYGGGAIVAAYLALNKIFGEAICRLGNLLLSDVIDEDVVRNARRTSVRKKEKKKELKKK